MADRAITALTQATSMTNADLFAISQGGQAKKVTWETFYTYLAEALDGHGGINSINYTAPTGTSLNGTLTVTLADGTTSSFTITNGRGITNIAKISTSGAQDTYRITYNDGTTSTFTVTNGRGVSSFVKTTDGLTDTYTITYTDNTTSEMVVTNGRSITGITWTESGTSGDGQIHTGTISYNDGSTSAVVITDGVKGDTGAAWYMHIKYSSIEPTADSDMKTTPDDWIGIYSGTSSTPPTAYTDYVWYQYKGEKGDTGTSITSVTLIGSVGAVDTYEIEFSDGTSTTFEITNGNDIDSITKTSTSGLVDTYTVTLTDGSNTAFDVTNGKGIASIVQTGGSHAAGTSDTYTITFNDGDTFSFQIYNGANGAGAVSTVAGIGVSGADGDVPLILKANGAPTQNTVGQENQLYYDLSGGVIYICLGESGGLYDWAGTGVRIDSDLSTTSERPVQNAVITQKVGTAALNTTAQDLSGAINEHESDIAGKVDKVTGKSLSTNDFTNAYKNKIGTATLNTVAQNLSGAVNELLSGQGGKAIRVSGTISSSQLYISNAGITTDMVLVSCVFGTPANVASDLTWSTGTAGRLSFTGTLNGSTTVDAVLIKI